MYLYPYDDYDCNDVYYDELSAPSVGISAAVTPPPSFTPLAGSSISEEFSALAGTQSRYGIPMTRMARLLREYEVERGRPRMQPTIPFEGPLPSPGFTDPGWGVPRQPMRTFTWQRRGPTGWHRFGI